MNGRLAKKIRQLDRRDWRGRIRELYSLPLRKRLEFAWHIIMKN